MLTKPMVSIRLGKTPLLDSTGLSFILLGEAIKNQEKEKGSVTDGKRNYV